MNIAGGATFGGVEDGGAALAGAGAPEFMRAARRDATGRWGLAAAAAAAAHVGACKHRPCWRV